MITGLVSVLLLAQPAPVVCPIMGNPVSEGMAFHDYAGVRFTFCCGGCDVSFKSNPDRAISQAIRNRKVIGESLFDPVSRSRVLKNRSKGFSDYKGIRFYFHTAATKATFDKDPKAYGELPKMLSLHCAVTDEKIGGYANASDYVDFEGVRYYLCCGGCVDPMNAEPGKYAAKAKARAVKPMVADPSKNFGGPH